MGENELWHYRRGTGNPYPAGKQRILPGIVLIMFAAGFQDGRYSVYGSQAWESARIESGAFTAHAFHSGSTETPLAPGCHNIAHHILLESNRPRRSPSSEDVQMKNISRSMAARAYTAWKTVELSTASTMHSTKGPHPALPGNMLLQTYRGSKILGKLKFLTKKSRSLFKATPPAVILFCAAVFTAFPLPFLIRESGESHLQGIDPTPSGDQSPKETFRPIRISGFPGHSALNFAIEDLRSSFHKFNLKKLTIENETVQTELSFSPSPAGLNTTGETGWSGEYIPRESGRLFLQAATQGYGGNGSPELLSIAKSLPPNLIVPGCSPWTNSRGSQKRIFPGLVFRWLRNFHRAGVFSFDPSQHSIRISCIVSRNARALPLLSKLEGNRIPLSTLTIQQMSAASPTPGLEMIMEIRLEDAVNAYLGLLKSSTAYIRPGSSPHFNAGNSGPGFPSGTTDLHDALITCFLPGPIDYGSPENGEGEQSDFGEAAPSEFLLPDYLEFSGLISDSRGNFMVLEDLRTGSQIILGSGERYKNWICPGITPDTIADIRPQLLWEQLGNY